MRSVAAVLARRLTEAAMRSLGLSGRRSSRRRDYGIASLGIADITPPPPGLRGAGGAGRALGLLDDTAVDALTGERGLFGTAHSASTTAQGTPVASAGGRQSSTILADVSGAVPALDDPPAVGFSAAAPGSSGPARKSSNSTTAKPPRKPRSGKAQ